MRDLLPCLSAFNIAVKGAEVGQKHTPEDLSNVRLTTSTSSIWGEGHLCDMADRRTRSLTGALISSIIGIVIFLILLGAANALTSYVQSSALLRVVEFLNANVTLLILIAVIFLAGDLFSALAYPLNLLAPFFGAVGAALTIAFLLRLFVLADEITGVAVFSIFTGLLAPLICVTVFVITLIGGYTALFIDPPQEA